MIRRTLPSIVVIFTVSTAPLSSIAQTSSTAGMHLIDQHVDTQPQQLHSNDKHFIDTVDVPRAIQGAFISFATQTGEVTTPEPSVIQRIELASLQMVRAVQSRADT